MTGSTPRPSTATPRLPASAGPAAAVAALVRAHPLGAFLAWFFSVGQALAFTPVLARGAGVAVPGQPFIVASTLVGLLLPALVITRIVDGPEGLRRLWSSAVRVRVPLRWYALALVGVPIATIALTVALFGAPALTASTLLAALASGLVLQFVILLVSNNWWEEVAWTGFVQARLQERHGPARAAVLVGPLFALQHVSLVAGNPLLLSVAFMVVFALVAIPFRALQGWVFNRTGSLFVVGMVHAAGNATGAGSGFEGGSGLLPRLYDEPLVGSVQTLSSAVLGLLVLVATHARLGRPRRSPEELDPTQPAPAGTPAGVR